MLAKREEFKEKTKNALLFSEPPPEAKKKGPGRGRRDDYISDSGSDNGGNQDVGEGEKTRKKATKGRKGGKGEKRRRRVHSRSGSESDAPREKRGRKKGGLGKVNKTKANDEGLTGKQKMRIISKATISTSESDSDKNNGRRSRSRVRSSGNSIGVQHSNLIGFKIKFINLQDQGLEVNLVQVDQVVYYISINL